MTKHKAVSISGFSNLDSVSRSTAFRLLANGQLTRFKLGSKTLIRVDEAEAWFASLQV
jgi:hypothetical protein